MRIAIIGAGNVGGTLAKVWAAKGHVITLGVKNTAKPEIKAQLTENISAKTVHEAVQDTEVIVIAVHPPALQDVCQALGDTGNKVIIDCTNTIFEKPGDYQTATEAIATLVGSAHVVKAFNATGANIIGNAHFNGTIAPTFMCGDYDEDKKVVTTLARDAGFREAIDCGSSASSIYLEILAKAWVGLAMKAGFGRDIAFDLLRKGDS